MRGWVLLCVAADAISLRTGPLQPPNGAPDPTLVRFKSAVEALGSAVNSDHTWNNRIDCARFCSVSCQCASHITAIPSCQASCQACMVEGIPCGGLSEFPASSVSLPLTPPPPAKPELKQAQNGLDPLAKPDAQTVSLVQVSSKTQGPDDDAPTKSNQGETGQDKPDKPQEDKPQEDKPQGQDKQQQDQQDKPSSPAKVEQAEEVEEEQVEAYLQHRPTEHTTEQTAEQPKAEQSNSGKPKEHEQGSAEEESAPEQSLKTINDLEKELKKLLGNSKPSSLTSQLQDTSAMLKNLAEEVSTQQGAGFKPGKGLTISGGGLSGVVPNTALGTKLNSVIDQLEGLVSWVRATKLQGDIDMTKSDALNRIIARTADLLQAPK